MKSRQRWSNTGRGFAGLALALLTGVAQAKTLSAMAPLSSQAPNRSSATMAWPAARSILRRTRSPKTRPTITSSPRAGSRFAIRAGC